MVRIPEGVDPAEATTLVLSYLTSYQGVVRHARLAKPAQTPGDLMEKGDQVLDIYVAGGVGATGRVVVELCRMLGHNVFVTCSLKNFDNARALGATPFDYRDKNWVQEMKKHTVQGQGMDFCFDSMGDQNFAPSLSLLKRGGTLIATGFGSAVNQVLQGKMSRLGFVMTVSTAQILF